MKAIIDPTLVESNYFSTEMSKKYCGASQYKSLTGSRGAFACETAAIAEINGLVEHEPPSTAMLIGSYVDSYFEGTLDTFKYNNPDIFKKTGDKGLKSQYLHADKIIERIERDPYFMEFMSGEKQVIMTANFFGINWKIKMDSYLKDKCIVDLKVMKEITETFYLKDQGRVSLFEYWGYDIQAAIYQKTVEIVTGKRLPFFFAMASKQKPEPDIEIVYLEQQKIDDALSMIEANAQRIIDLKSGIAEPVRCEKCNYCRSTKILTRAVPSNEFMIGV